MKITFPPVILLASIVLQIILLFSFPISVDLSSLLGLILILSVYPWFLLALDL